MIDYIPSHELAARVVAGDLPAIARMISRVEAGLAEARQAQAFLYEVSGSAHVIGVTGVPGSGKSTLVAKLARLLTDLGERVAIIAVDPSSPYSGGSILGDRVRMSELANSGVFIRSMATRGATGGLARATLDAVDILDAGGFRTIFIETVGIGQDEVEVATASTTTVVVSAPGLGDDIQALKAGMLEIADIHVVSKSDRKDANRTIADLKQMVAAGMRITGGGDWRVPVIGVSAIVDQGLDTLVEAMLRHRVASVDGLGDARRARIAEFRIAKTAELLLMSRLTKELKPLCAKFAPDVINRKRDPYSVANELVRIRDTMEAS